MSVPLRRLPRRDRSENRRHVDALKRRESWLDFQLDGGHARDTDRSRTVAERNALRFAIAICERWISEGGEDDL